MIIQKFLKLMKNFITKIFNKWFKRPTTLDTFYEHTKIIDQVLEIKQETRISPVPGCVIFSCSCGRSTKIRVNNIAEPGTWTCPISGCTGKVTIFDRIRR
jgi:hypothetical protein